MTIPPMPVGHVQDQDGFNVLIRHLTDTGAYWLYFLAIFGLVISPACWYLPQILGGLTPPVGRTAETWGVRYGLRIMGAWSLLAAITLT